MKEMSHSFSAIANPFIQMKITFRFTTAVELYYLSPISSVSLVYLFNRVYISN